MRKYTRQLVKDLESISKLQEDVVKLQLEVNELTKKLSAVADRLGNHIMYQSEKR